MARIGSILLPTDFSPASLVTARYCGLLARHFKARVTILNVLPLPNYAEIYAMGESRVLLHDVQRYHRVAAQQQLDPFAVEEMQGCTVKRTLIESSDPAGAILDVSTTEQSDLIMMATRGCGVFRRLILGSVTAKVLHDAHRPVWTGVHIEQTPPPLKADYETILCAVDIDSEHLDPVRWAAGIASEYRARLVLVHAIQRIEYSPVTFQFDAAVRASVVDAATERLSKIAQSCGIEHGDFYIDGGTPYNVVRAAAQERKADLVVIGRPAKGSVIGRLRSNSYAIIRESPCPVVSV